MYTKSMTYTQKTYTTNYPQKNTANDARKHLQDLLQTVINGYQAFRSNIELLPKLGGYIIELISNKQDELRYGNVSNSFFQSSTIYAQQVSQQNQRDSTESSSTLRGQSKSATVVQQIQPSISPQFRATSNTNSPVRHSISQPVSIPPSPAKKRDATHGDEEDYISKQDRGPTSKKEANISRQSQTSSSSENSYSILKEMPEEENPVAKQKQKISQSLPNPELRTTSTPKVYRSLDNSPNSPSSQTEFNKGPYVKQTLSSEDSDAAQEYSQYGQHSATVQNYSVPEEIRSSITNIPDFDRYLTNVCKDKDATDEFRNWVIQSCTVGFQHVPPLEQLKKLILDDLKDCQKQNRVTNNNLFYGNKTEQRDSEDFFVLATAEEEGIPLYSIRGEGRTTPAPVKLVINESTSTTMPSTNQPILDSDTDENVDNDDEKIVHNELDLRPIDIIVGIYDIIENITSGKTITNNKIYNKYYNSIAKIHQNTTTMDQFCTFLEEQLLIIHNNAQLNENDENFQRRKTFENIKKNILESFNNLELNNDIDSTQKNQGEFIKATLQQINKVIKNPNPAYKGRIIKSYVFVCQDHKMANELKDWVKNLSSKLPNKTEDVDAVSIFFANQVQKTIVEFSKSTDNPIQEYELAILTNPMVDSEEKKEIIDKVNNLLMTPDFINYIVKLGNTINFIIDSEESHRNSLISLSREASHNDISRRNKHKISNDFYNLFMQDKTHELSIFSRIQRISTHDGIATRIFGSLINETRLDKLKRIINYWSTIDGLQIVLGLTNAPLTRIAIEPDKHSTINLEGGDEQNHQQHIMNTSLHSNRHDLTEGSNLQTLSTSVPQPPTLPLGKKANHSTGSLTRRPIHNVSDGNSPSNLMSDLVSNPKFQQRVDQSNSLPNHNRLGSTSGTSANPQPGILHISNQPRLLQPITQISKPQYQFKCQDRQPMTLSQQQAQLKDILGDSKRKLTAKERVVGEMLATQIEIAALEIEDPSESYDEKLQKLLEDFDNGQFDKPDAMHSVAPTRKPIVSAQIPEQVGSSVISRSFKGLEEENESDNQFHHRGTSYLQDIIEGIKEYTKPKDQAVTDPKPLSNIDNTNQSADPVTKENVSELNRSQEHGSNEINDEKIVEFVKLQKRFAELEELHSLLAKDSDDYTSYGDAEDLSGGESSSVSSEDPYSSEYNLEEEYKKLFGEYEEFLSKSETQKNVEGSHESMTTNSTAGTVENVVDNKTFQLQVIKFMDEKLKEIYKDREELGKKLNEVVGQQQDQISKFYETREKQIDNALKQLREENNTALEDMQETLAEAFGCSIEELESILSNNEESSEDPKTLSKEEVLKLLEKHKTEFESKRDADKKFIENRTRILLHPQLDETAAKKVLQETPQIMLKKAAASKPVWMISRNKTPAMAVTKEEKESSESRGTIASGVNMQASSANIRVKENTLIGKSARSNVPQILRPAHSQPQELIPELQKRLAEEAKSKQELEKQVQQMLKIEERRNKEKAARQQEKQRLEEKRQQEKAAKQEEKKKLEEQRQQKEQALQHEVQAQKDANASLGTKLDQMMNLLLAMQQSQSQSVPVAPVQVSVPTIIKTKPEDPLVKEKGLSPTKSTEDLKKTQEDVEEQRKIQEDIDYIRDNSNKLYSHLEEIRAKDATGANQKGQIINIITLMKQTTEKLDKLRRSRSVSRERASLNSVETKSIRDELDKIKGKIEATTDDLGAKLLVAIEAANSMWSIIKDKEVAEERPQELRRTSSFRSTTANEGIPEIVNASGRATSEIIDDDTPHKDVASRKLGSLARHDSLKIPSQNEVLSSTNEQKEERRIEKGINKSQSSSYVESPASKILSNLTTTESTSDTSKDTNSNNTEANTLTNIGGIGTDKEIKR